MEILSPAGSADAVIAAVRTGADAVYLGGEAFSARSGAEFSNDELAAAVQFCHLHGVKVHLAVNTLLFDSELEEFAKTIEAAAKIGVDAMIVQDLGALTIVGKIAPQMPLHASTQMSLHTREGAKIAKKLGFSRVVLAREVSAGGIATMTNIGIETEVFVHGALCMSVSGQCFLSAMMGGRSANRGRCGQACRLPFSATIGAENCDLSLKDLSLVGEVSALERLGVTSLKIEGRRKRPEYVAAATAAVFAARKGDSPNLETLQAVFSRGGFTDGYYRNLLGGEMFGVRGREDVVAAAEVLPELRELYRKETKATTIQFVLTIKADIPATLLLMSGDGASVTVAGEVPQVAQNRPIDLAFAEKQLSKLGDTVYEWDGVSGDFEDGLMLTAAALNDLRRRGIAALDEQRVVENAPKYTASSNFSNATISQKAGKRQPKYRLEITMAEQLAGVDLADIEMVILPLDEAEKVAPDEKICLFPPRFILDEVAVAEQLKAAKARGFSHLYCNNLAHIALGNEAGFALHGGFGLNVTNSLTIAALEELGLHDITASFELKLGQLSALVGRVPVGMLGYGRLPLMLMRNCPIRSAHGSCNDCSGALSDRTGRSLPVVCDKAKTFTELLNSDVLYLGDRLSEISADFITLKFSKEPASEVSWVLQRYRAGEKPRDDITRGLYYRGVSSGNN